MTSATVSVERAAPRIRVSAEVLGPVAVGALFVALALLTRRTWGNLGQDTGYDLVAASRVAHGELPYRDFFYYYGPLAPFALGAAMWIGGGVGSAIAFGLAVTAGILALTYLLARAVGGVVGGVLASVLVAAVAFLPSNFSYVLPHTESATLGTLLLLGVVLALRRRSMGGAAWLVGLCTLTRVEVAAAALASLAAWTAIARPGRRAAASLVARACIVPAVVYGALAALTGTHRLLFENLYPVQTLRVAGNAVVRTHAPLTLASFVRLGGDALLYAGGVIVLLFAARAAGTRLTASRALVAGAVLGMLAAIVRPASFQFWSGYAYLWIPVGAVVAVVVARRSRDTTLAAEAAMLALLASTTYAAFQLQATRPQPAVYAAPFAALLLVRLHVRLGAPLGMAWLAFLALGAVVVTVHLASAKSAIVRGPGGAVAASPADAPAYQRAVDWIVSHTRPGAPVLLAPQLSTLYTLSGREDPVPQISLLPGALPHRSDELALIRTLDRAHVDVAVIDRHAFPEYGHTVFGGSFDTTLAAWLHRTFRHVAVVGVPGARTLDIWQRRST